MDIPAMVEAFAGTAVGTAEIPNLSLPPAQLLPTKSMAPQAPQQPQELQEASCVSTGSISAGSSIHRSSSVRTASSRSSKSSNCKLTSSAILRLLADFAENFKKFTVLEAFEDEADNAEICAVLEARPGGLLQELNGSERAYLALICVLESAKKDDGSRSTKALGDTLKIAKFAKAMIDVMRAKVPEAVHHQLAAYCFRLNALYTLQQRSGRFNQLYYETSVAFPPRWDTLTAEDITTVIGQVMALRKELVSYNNRLAIWKKGHKAAKESIKPVIPALSTPASTPKNGSASV
ncbi:hypothetical protein KI688_001439 [Linnemannia hyalina]|uniref:Uncharacterized protein n=1 Tax=Linnemannia hyalina TaxID=64524 RepID=A0A9P8BSF6_9FUNG|nr:hypothetical protein KI688_001439 [Linnemannia hyalina]